jgi:predicted amidohydrolase
MLQFVDQIASEGRIDLIVFPELANAGYVKPRDREFGKRYLKAAEPIPGPTTRALSDAARDRGVHIVVGLAELHPTVGATLYNSAVLIGPAGRILGVHHKIHIPGEEKHYFYPGNTTDCFDTDFGRLGLVICYDFHFPELCRTLALKGAEILCAVFAGDRKRSYSERRFEYLAGARALENRHYVLACNRVGTEEERVFCGHSVVMAPTGEIVCQAASTEEAVLRGKLHHDLLLEERAYTTTFRDRRPELYGPVCQAL